MRAWPIVCALVLSAARASAVEPIRLEVDAEMPEGCPGAEALRAQVERRLGPGTLDDGAARGVRAGIRRTDGALTGTVTLVAADGRVAGERRLEAAPGECGELVKAMALAISIAADPLQALAPEPPEPPPPEPPPAVEPPPPPEPPPLTLAAPPIPDVPAPSPAPPGLDLVVALGGAVSLGTAPALAPGLTLEVGARSGWWSVAAEARGDLPAGEEVAGGEVRATLLAGTLVPCAHAGPWAACALATAGLLRGEGVDFEDTFRVDAPYLAGGLRGLAEWPLNEALGLRFWADLRAPITRVTLRVDDDVVWKSPRISTGFGFGVTGRL
jgi:hypothetical protein